MCASGKYVFKLHYIKKELKFKSQVMNPDNKIHIFREIIQQHDPDPAYPDTFSGYTQDTPPDTQLLAKAPYDELYLYCLQMRADLVNQEYDKYNNDLLLFSAAWGAFARAYHREHRFRLTPPWLRF
jgi:hypothetical protein